MEKVPMTMEGYASMQDEVKTLKSVERPRIIHAIEEARAHGDLSENAEYHAAKEAQSWNETRIGELEDRLGRAEVIDNFQDGFGEPVGRNLSPVIELQREQYLESPPVAAHKSSFP